jgi:hypothetical protein
MARFDLSSDGEAGENKIPVMDLPDICARHRWNDPATVQRIVTFLVDAHRSRRKAHVDA